MRRFTYLALVVLVAACTQVGQEQPNCEHLTATALRERISKEISPEQFRAWISATYRVPEENIQVDATRTGKSRIFNWKAGGIWYTAVIEGSALTDVELLYERQRPSADQVIACLGAPEQYRASYGWDIPGNNLHLDLLFPGQGILAFGAQFQSLRPKEPPPITGRFRISDMRIVRTGSVDEVLRQIYGGSSAELYEKMQREYKSWPDDWKAIEIEIDPKVRQ